MTEAIYIKKPEDIINLSPDGENYITKDKNNINDKYKRRRDAQEGNPEYGDKAVNNNENKFGYSGNYYVKEPGSEESLNTPGGFHDNDSEPRDLDVADPPDTSNMNELTAYNYDDNTAGTDSIPLEPLALDESFEENSRRLVEVDDDGNTLKTHSRIPSKYAKSGVPTPQNPQTEHLLQALARLDLETIPTESHDVQPVATDEDYLTPRTHEHIYAEIVDRKVERHVKPTGSVRVVENERRVRVPIIRRLTRTFSINRRHGHGHRNSSSTLYRNTLSKLPKTPPEKENVTCSCSKKILMFSVVCVVFLLCVIAAVLLTLVLNKRDEKVKPKDVIFPTVTCPGSQVVTLNQRKKHVTLQGAETKDNTGIKLLEYKAVIEDDSAAFEEPDILVLTRHSLGNKYVISVKTLDLDDNEASCNYTISVQEDACVPWRLPEVDGSRKEVPTQDGGWQVTLQCAGHKNGAAGERAPHILSYYYLDNRTVFTCSSGQGFLPEQSFSCQEADLARFKYITSIMYQFLDNNGEQLQNITMEKAKSCFDSYYTKRLLNIQQKKAMELDQSIKNPGSSSTFGDVSQIELAPIPYGYPKILEYDQRNGKIHAMKVGIGYQIGPVNQPFPDNLLNVYVRGIIQTRHTTLFSPDMRPFGRLQGNVNAGCPDVLAPPTSTLFEPVSSGFMCSEGQKKHVVYDEHIEADVTVCLGCPVGEFYNLSMSSCQACPLNTYQDVVGTMECKRCPPNTTTAHTGARQLNDCKLKTKQTRKNT